MPSFRNWPDLIQQRLNRAITRRVGLFVKIVLPVVVLFLIFSGVLGVWISGLTRGALLDQSRRQTESQFTTTRFFLEMEWSDFAANLGNPAYQGEMPSLVSKGMVDVTSTLLKKMASELGADVLHAYDREGRLLASSADISSYQEPALLASIARDSLKKAAGGWFLAELPEELLRFENLDPKPRGEKGSVVAVVAHAVITDDFGDPIGLVVGFRIINGKQETMQRISKLVGAQITVIQGDLRVATSLVDRKGTSLLASRLGQMAVKSLEGSDTASGLVDIGGGTYDSRYEWLADPQGRRVMLLGVTNPVDAVLRDAARVRNRILMAGLLALVGFTLILGLVIRALLGGMERIRSYMGSVAAGYLGATLKVESRDEMEELGDAISGTVTRLRELVSRVEASFNQVESVSGDLVRMGDAVAAAAGEQESAVTELDAATTSLAGIMDKVSSGMAAMKGSARKNLSSLESLSGMVGNTSSSASTLAASATESTTAIHEMTASLSQVAASVAQLTQFITETSQAMKEIDQAAGRVKDLSSRGREAVRELSHEASENGRNAMSRANKGMESIKELMASLSGTVKEVGIRSEEISEVVGLISEIADQTNLLALNASILAAQTGEQGRAFAVVAGEIRTLSERTDNSIKQIEGNIHSIQDKSRKAVEEVDKGFRVVDSGVGEVGRVEKVLEKIIASASQTRELTEKIAEQSTAQSGESTKVSDSLLQISSMAEQLSSAATQQKETAQYILKVSEGMGVSAEGMKRSAAGQFDNVKGLRGEVEGTSSMAERLEGGAGESRRGLATVRDSIGVIRRSVDENRNRVAELRKAVDELGAQAQEVRKEISSFKLEA